MTSRIRFTAALAAVGLAVTPTVSAAFGPPVIPPIDNPVVDTPGPTVPYISGRLGPREAGLPAGGVVPDDFCLPGKFDDCGDHLRDAANAPFGGADDVVTIELDDQLWAAWVDGSFRRTEWTTTNDMSESASLSLGVDRTFSDGLILGGMISGINDRMSNSVANTEDHAQGLMYGPYFVYQTEGVVTIDGRLLYGSADHIVRTAGVQTGTYQSTNWAVALRGSAELQRENWLLFPAIELSWQNQTSDAYTDTIAGAVARTSTDEAFLTIGGLAHYEGLGNGNLVPIAGLNGHFDLVNQNIFASIGVGLVNNFENGGMAYIDYVESALGLAGVTDRQVSIGLQLTF